MATFQGQITSEPSRDDTLGAHFQSTGQNSSRKVVHGVGYATKAKTYRPFDRANSVATATLFEYCRAQSCQVRLQGFWVMRKCL